MLNPSDSSFEDDAAVDARSQGPASSARARKEALATQIAELSDLSLVGALLDAAGACVCILNGHRQIVFGNAALRSLLGPVGVQSLLGQRPGEALECLNASRCPGGCGTAPECGTCGAVQAILECQRSGTTTERECLIAVCRDASFGTLEVAVRASPLVLSGEAFTILSLRDLSAEKRRDALERVFLHDLANTVSPLLAWSEVLVHRVTGEAEGIAKRLASLAERLRKEIEQQRVLLQAERGTLATKRDTVKPNVVCESALRVAEGYAEAQGKVLQLEHKASHGSIVTDEALLVRVLVNMLKNALEATPAAGVVQLATNDGLDYCEFRVWNAGAIPAPIAQQIFKRSFSTKRERGRGLGTFSMKLFGERYLGGKVGFSSSERGGTTFFIRVPKTPDRM
jgi:hypothetical protein